MIETQVILDSSVQVKPFGNLDWMSAVTLRHVVHDLIRPGIQVDIDLSEVNAIDAVGISSVAGSIRRIRSVGGDVRISNPPPEVQRRLRLAGIYGLLAPGPQTSGDAA
jgi:anti-anti-sigma factor